MMYSRQTDQALISTTPSVPNYRSLCTYIIKTMYLEKPKWPIIWNDGSIRE